MLESAITGIAKGVMTFENDPILPLATRTMNKRVGDFKNLSEEAKLKLVALTE